MGVWEGERRGRRDARKGGREGWLMPTSFLVAAFRYDQNKQRTSEAKGRLPTVLVSFFFLFAILFISFCCCCCQAMSQTDQESRWIEKKQEDKVEDMQTGKQTGHAAEHRVHLGFNLCCVSWVRSHMVYRREKFRDGTRLQPKTGT